MRALGAIYEETRARIVDLVRGADGDAAATTVPACPDWSVRDVVAHVTGACADILAGNVGDAGTDSWTAEQVGKRKDRAVDELLAEWDDIGPTVAAIVDDFPGRRGRQVIGDLAVHEHDVRGALRRPGARDSAAVDNCVDFLVLAFLHPAATALGVGPLDVRAGERRWVAGTGGPPTGDPDEAINAALFTPDGDASTSSASSPPVATLTAEPFELFRALTGRRSAAQVRRLDWSDDPEPYVPLFGVGLFAMRDTDLVE